MPHEVLKDSDYEVKQRGNILAERSFQNYPLDKFFSPLGFKLFVIPEGYKGVRLRLGDRLNLWGMQIGQEIEPGIRFMLGLKSLWSSVAVVNTQKRTLEMKMKDAISKDGVEFPEVDASLNWRVADPIEAMTRAEDYKFTVRQFAEARVRDYVGTHEFDDLLKVEGKRKDLVYTVDSSGVAVRFPMLPLDDIGTEIQNLYITRLGVPEGLTKLLSQQAQKESEAKGALKLAQYQVRIAKQHALAAKQYANEDARFAAMLDIAKELAQNGRTIAVNGPGGLMEAVESYFGSVSSRPTPAPVSTPPLLP